MECTIIAESSGNSIHPITAQLVGAASSLGATTTVVVPGGVGADDAATIDGVSKVVSIVGDCFSTFDGGAWASVIASQCSGVITLRANAFDAAGSGGSAAVNVVDQSADVSVAVKEAISKASERLDVSEADIIISGGRGIGQKENFSELEDVADLIGAAVGASRAVVDEWGMPHSMQVGQTGKTVTPSLYIAVGISGAIQHLAGMRSSKYIVAINKDPEAPIFGVADYGIVATWEEAVPALKTALASL
ncbi:MAG: electron transfer flavoprotein subunit alpha/FixB family protein [Euryarchaeota archaeon]|nr:electron transfer flavoprotein subunit alpha/FixB family protein [Euryarchaeota archaeon]